MSDSLNATVIVSVLVLTISAKSVLVVELPDEELEEPRLPELVALVAPEELEPELVELAEEPLLLEVTVSPGERLSSETIVPTVGE
jgi:hypothetical protein